MASSFAAARKATSSTTIFNKLLNPIRSFSTAPTFVPRSYVITPHMPGFNNTTPKYIINAQTPDFDDSTPNISSADSRGSSRSSIKEMLDNLDLNSQIGNSMPLAHIRLGTFIHCIEMKPGQGAKMVRSAGTSGKILRQRKGQCVVRLPSGVEKVVDSRCQATIGVVSNPSHRARKLYKAGQSRWLGRRPHVRGVAMNPVDHPHGGGEGRTSGGRPSVTPWGKPTKSGYKTAKLKRKN